jgi:dephospho-CoA kinase
MMTVVGLTGGIGSGKSEVARVWSECGATLLEADKYGHQVLESDRSVKRKLVAKFGDAILTSKGDINRAEVARQAFSSQAATRFLNRTVGGPLVKLLHADVNRLRRKKSGILVVDAALICEWRSPVPFDARVLVTAPRRLKLKWLSRRGVSYRQAQSRMQMQWSDVRKRRWADIEIRNDGSLDGLRRKALAVWNIELKAVEPGVLFSYYNRVR